MVLLLRILLCLLYLLLFHFPFSYSSYYSSSSLHHSSSRPPFLCHHDQSSALLQFKNSLGVGNYHYRSCDQSILKTTTWEDGTDCCSWEGVTCDSMSGHVIGLDLSCSVLDGNIHSNSTLFHLTHLHRLNLAFNYFSQLPSQMGGFPSLTHLNLSSCGLEGDIPSQISHLSKLTSLDFSRNYGLNWKGTTWMRLMQNATMLREILVAHTNMSSISPTPSLPSLPKWPSSFSLVTLDLVSTGISGELTSDILCLPNLQQLYLSDLQVHLPGKLNCSASLTVLDLSECSFQGTIPSSFANLTHLTSLILSSNNLKGSIPSFLSNLQHLTHLHLSNNEFSGPIPSSLSKLSHLTHLHLSHNHLSGQIPPSLFSSTQLSSLDCSFNKFEGPLPKKVTGLSNLTQLHLNNNQLNESIPSWCLSLPSLESLDLKNNQFTGHIGEISPSLKELHLCGNKLQGNIVQSIVNLENLTSLCLSSNNWSSPVHFRLFSKFQKLQVLSLSGFSSLSLKSEINVSYSFPMLGELQLLFNNLTDYVESLVKFPVLQALEISSSNLQGKVPKWILDIDSLEELVLTHNSLTSMDPLPWNSMYYLDLSFNLMTGDISSLICNATSLFNIILSHNNFTGTFPQCLANFSGVLTLDLQMNNLHGTLPPMNEYLSTLNLNGNQFEGPLPKSLSNCTNLMDLNLGNNRIVDLFPHWLENHEGLKILVLRANKLYGPIVSSQSKNPFPSITIFDISSNNFSGSLPEDYIKSFQAMKIDLQETDFEYMESYSGIPTNFIGDTMEYDNSLDATVKGVNTPYTKIPMLLVNIDLSVNKFEGEIPNIIGELQGLKGLNLSHNMLTGIIPDSMGNLTNLESLDLSSNMLTGGIPLELTNLNSLEVLNLAHNHLVGPIPQGKQFNTFSNESYEGNTGLCGFPLTIQCNKGSHQLPPSETETEDKFGFGWKPVAIGYGCGMVFGIGLGCLVLFIGKPIWLVSMFGGVGVSNKRARKRRSRATRAHGNHTRVN